MKNTLLVIICLFATSLLFAQKKEWKQMEDFHDVMSKSYHPAAAGNLKPVKDNIDGLIQKAKAWQTSVIPPACSTKPVKPLLDKLVTECVAIKEAITQKKTDVVLKKMITTAHTTFHQITEKCE